MPRLPSLLLAVLLCAVRAVAFPQIFDFNPKAGVPGSQVTITGQQLGGITQVVFGTAKASILARSDSGLVVVVPLDGTSAPIYVYDQQSQFDYTVTAFQVSPRVSSFSPNHGVVGEEVVIEGFNLGNINNQDLAPLVFFNDIQAFVYVASDTQLRATVPLNATTGPIKVMTLAGSYSTPSPFYMAPIITSFTPGRAQVGEVLTIKGYNFIGAREARVGGSLATILNAQLNQMTVIVPAGALDGALYVETPGGAFFSDPSKPFLLLPKIDSFNPPGGPVGAAVQVVGTGLSSATQVYVGEKVAPVTAATPTTASFAVPSGAVSAPLTIVTLNGTNKSDGTFYVAPTVASFTPLRGQTGSVVTVTGLNLKGTTAVEFGGVPTPQFTVVDNTKLTARVPSGALNGLIRVTNPGGSATTSIGFEVLGDEPTITAFNPVFGAPGASIALTGFNFTDATNVTFGGVSAVPTVQGDTRIVVTVPPGAVSGPLRVFTPKGSGESAEDFVVGDSADLKLTITGLPNPPVAGARLVYSVDVRNAGPLDATAVIVTFAIPKESEYVNASASRGTFEKLGSSVINTVGKLNAGATATLLVMVKPKAEGAVTAAAQVTADSPDTNPSNNAAKLVLTAVPVTLKLDQIGNGFVRIVWSDAATNYVVEAASSLKSGTWTEVTNSVFHIDDQFRVAIPYQPSANQYFRLRQLP